MKSFPEKAMAPYSSSLAWKIPWMEEPDGLQSMGSLRVGHDWATSLSLFTFMHWRRKWHPTPVFLPGESQGWGSLVGCRIWGRTESDTTDATSQQHEVLSVLSFPISPILKKKKSVSRLVLSTSLQPHGLYVARQTPLSMGFSRQEYWGRLPFPSPGDPHNPGVEPGFPVLQEDSLPSEPPRKPISHPSDS